MRPTCPANPFLPGEDMKLLIMQFFQPSCHFIPLTSKYHVYHDISPLDREKTGNSHRQLNRPLRRTIPFACDYEQRKFEHFTSVTNESSLRGELLYHFIVEQAAKLSSLMQQLRGRVRAD
jgi:hypothetical protein